MQRENRPVSAVYFGNTHLRRDGPTDQSAATAIKSTDGSGPSSRFTVTASRAHDQSAVLVARLDVGGAYINWCRDRVARTCRAIDVAGALIARLPAQGQSGLAFQRHGDAHAAADAQRREALLGVPLLHLMQQGDQDARARGADRVADGDRAAVDVHLGGVPAEVLVDRQRLGGEGFVGLDQVEVVGLPAGALQHLAGGGDRAGAHHRGIDAGGGEAGDAGQRGQAALGGFGGGHQDQRRGAVIDAGGVAGGDRAVLGEGGTQLGHGLRAGSRGGCIRRPPPGCRPCGSSP